MKNVVVLSFGTEKEWKRAIFTVLSFWSWFEGNEQNVRVLIYTDNPEYFASYLKDFKVSYVNISLAEIKKSVEKTGYMYRFKISVVERTFTHYPNDDLLFVDTDTFFIVNPHRLLEELQPGKSFMHLREYTFDEGIYKWLKPSTPATQRYPRDFINLIENKSFSIANQEIKFNRFQYVWNSGVLGFTNEIVPYLPDVYALTDEFYAKSAWRISEQIAFTLVLNQVTKISEAVKYLNHYWFYKDRVDLRLDEFLNHNFRSLSLLEKKAAVKKLTQKMDKLIYHEQMVTNTKESVHDKDYVSAFKFAAKALFGVPLNDDLIKILKYRFSKLASLVFLSALDGLSYI